MKPQVLTTAKSAPRGSVDQLVAVQLQQAEHPLAVDEILWAAEADERVAALRGAARKLSRKSVWHVVAKI